MKWRFSDSDFSRGLWQSTKSRLFFALISQPFQHLGLAFAWITPVELDSGRGDGLAGLWASDARREWNSSGFAYSPTQPIDSSLIPCWRLNTHGNPYDMMGTFISHMPKHPNFIHIESCLAQPFGKRGIRAGGPYGQHAFSL